MTNHWSDAQIEVGEERGRMMLETLW